MALGATYLKGQMWKGLGVRKSSTSLEVRAGGSVDHREGSSLELEDVAEPLAALHQWLCDAGQAINLPDPVPAPTKQE